MNDETKVILLALECLLKTVAKNEIKPWKLSKEEFEEFDQIKNNYIDATIKCINLIKQKPQEKE